MIEVFEITCRERGDVFVLDKSVSKSGNKEDVKEKGSPILCGFCRAKITTVGQMIEVNGSYRHTFTNPHGKVFEIGCFSSAPGCISHGPATHDCTWFAGCSWRFSLCANCFAHIGWKYQSSLSGSFYGLVLVHLLWE